MTKERPGSPPGRMFVALDLPEQIREGLAAWQQAACAGLPELRAVQPEALHVTLCFLGYRPLRDAERIKGLLEGVDSAAPELAFAAEVAKVPERRPKLLAASAESPGCVRLQESVSAALEAERLYEPEKRPFWPHVTVARLRPERRGSRRPSRLSGDPPPLQAALQSPFHAVRIALYRSHLRPQGARYESLARRELTPS